MDSGLRSGDNKALLFEKRPTNYQPNVFTESRQEFTELEKKIVVLVVNQIGHMSLKGKIPTNSNLVFHIPFQELTKKNYSVIADAAVTLQSKRLMYRNDKTQQLDIITPFPRVKFDTVEGKKVIEVTMFADVVPHFAELGQRYTKYECDIMLSLRSVYAQRMFDIVSMFQCRSQYRFSYRLDRLMEMLNCPETYSFNDFKKNVLFVAQKELQQVAKIALDWTPSKKAGKKVIELEFSINSTRKNAAEAVEQDRQTISQMPVHQVVATAWQLMKKYKLKDWQKELIVSDFSLLEIFYRLDSEINNGLRGEIRNKTAYLVKSLGIDQQKAPAKTGEPEPPVSAPAMMPAPAPKPSGSVLPQGPAVRSNTPMSLGSILGDLKMGG